MEHKEEYHGKMEQQLREWGAKIDGLIAKAETATEEAKSRYHTQIQDLRGKQEVARKKLHELQEDSGEAWDELSVGMEHAWKDLKHAFEKAAAKFSDDTDADDGSPSA